MSSNELPILIPENETSILFSTILDSTLLASVCMNQLRVYFLLVLLTKSKKKYLKKAKSNTLHMNMVACMWVTVKVSITQ